jgi:hypothetical protein
MVPKFSLPGSRRAAARMSCTDLSDELGLVATSNP